MPNESEAPGAMHAPEVDVPDKEGLYVPKQPPTASPPNMAFFAMLLFPRRSSSYFFALWRLTWSADDKMTAQQCHGE